MRRSRAFAGRMPPAAPTAILGAAILLSLFGGILAPNDPYAQDLAHRLMPPPWMDGGSPQFLFGTDQLGRDILSRIIVGTQASVIVGIFGVIAGAVLGSIAGLLGGYLGGVADAFVMRLVDAFLSVPIILFAVLLAIVIEPGILAVFGQRGLGPAIEGDMSEGGKKHALAGMGRLGIDVFGHGTITGCCRRCRAGLGPDPASHGAIHRRSTAGKDRSYA